MTISPAAPEWFGTPRGGPKFGPPAWLSKLRHTGIGLAAVYYARLAWLALFARRPSAPPPDPLMDEIGRQMAAVNPLEPFWSVTRGLLAYLLRRMEIPSPRLELATQSGVLSSIAFAGQRVDYGSDLDPLYLEELRRRTHFDRTALLDAHQLPFADASLNSVILLNAIYHMDRARVLREVGRVLRPGGKLVLSDAPGWLRIHPVANLLRHCGLPKMAQRHLDYQRHRHSIVELPSIRWPADAGETSGLLTEAVLPFASQRLSERTRDFYFLLNELGASGTAPWVARFHRRIPLARHVVETAWRRYWIPAMRAERDGCPERQAVQVLVVLRKPGRLESAPAPETLCPTCRSRLADDGSALRCVTAGHVFPRVGGVSVLVPNWESVADLAALAEVRPR